MDEIEMQRFLAELYQDRANPNAQSVDFYLSKMHVLAENQYQPAIPFFLEGLDDPRWDWRVDSLSALGFHYTFPANSPVIERIRQLLRNDPDDGVRSSAAWVLSAQKHWPEPTLLDALQKDPSQLVRESCFGAILRLLGVPPYIQLEKSEEVKSKRLEPTWDEIQRIAATYGDLPHLPSK